ncbi:gfo/Idh/MocA family oxidoreductase [Verrucomicrobia bacterium LW23]|nr:gfo/Idh/MocA family oxidoreductase [Verrucomicrobia bacterium LW23]
MSAATVSAPATPAVSDTLASAASPATSHVNIGLIGCGQRLRLVTANLIAAAAEHAALAGAGSPGTDTEAAPRTIRVAAVFDPAPAAAERARSELGTPETLVCGTVEELLASDIEWVMVGSWNCFHADQICAALAAGKHIFAEKPLATTTEDCVRIREAWLAAGDRRFFFGLVLRYAPIYIKAKELLSQGIVGHPISVEFNETIEFNHGGYIHGCWRRQRKNAGTHLLEKCCHDFDLVNWLLESVPVRAASFGGTDIFRPEMRHLAEALSPDAQGRAPYRAWHDPSCIDPFTEGSEIVDNQVAILQYANGARATFHTNCHAGLPERRLLILGTKGALRLDAVTGTIEWRRIGFDAPHEVIRLTQGGMHFGADTVMATHLARTITDDAPPLATLDDGLRSAIACMGVDDALDSGTIVDLRPLWARAGVQV